MKVKEAFAATFKKIHEGKNYGKYNNPTLLQAIAFIENKQSYTQLVHLCIKNQNRDFTQRIAEVFITFLTQRWNAIRFTQQAYYLVPNDPFTRLLVILARDLARAHGARKSHKGAASPKQHFLKYLMPSIETFNPLVNMDIRDCDQQIENYEISEAINLREIAQSKPVIVELLSEPPLGPPVEPLVEPESGDGEWEDMPELEQLVESYVNTTIKPCTFQLKTTSEILTAKQLAATIHKGKANAAKKKIGLHHITLADNGIYIISVMACLLDSKFDSILKQTSALTAVLRKVIPLTASEKKRVIFHSKEAHQLYNAVQDFNYIRNRGLSIGAAINRLVTRLRSSGVNGGRDGREGLAGREAAIGVRKFQNYLNLLPPAYRNMVMEARSSFEREKNFKHNWHLLLARIYYFQEDSSELIVLSHDEEYELNSTVEETNQYPCVELVATNLEAILAYNQEFYNLGLDAKSLPPSVYEMLDDLVDIDEVDYAAVLFAMTDAEHAFNVAQEGNTFAELTLADQRICGSILWRVLKNFCRTGKHSQPSI
jgi:hypothetical protein